MAYIPTFKGRHNTTKAMIWCLLTELDKAEQPGLRLAELQDAAQVAYRSLSASLGRWIGDGCVAAEQTPTGRIYTIGDKGLYWVYQWSSVIPAHILVEAQAASVKIIDARSKAAINV